MRVFLICLLAVSAFAGELTEPVKSHTRRGILADEPVRSVELLATDLHPPSPGYADSYSEAGSASGWNSGIIAGRQIVPSSGYEQEIIAGNQIAAGNGFESGIAVGSQIGVSSGLENGIIAENQIAGAGSGLNALPVRQFVPSNGPVTQNVVNRVVQVPVPVPQPVQVTRDVQVRVPYPVPVEHRRPVAVRVPQPYPVHVDKPYTVHVDRPYPVPVPQAVRVTYPRFIVPIPVPQPYAVPLHPSSGIPLAGGNLLASAPLNYAAQASPLNYAAQASPLNYASSAPLASANNVAIASHGSQISSAGYSSGSWSGASYPGLQSYSSAHSGNNEGYSYDAAYKKW